MKVLRRIAIFGIALAVTIVSVQCGKKTAGSGSEQALLKMLPENASGYMVFNFKKVAELGLFKTMQESMQKEEIEKAAAALNTFKQFITQTGFDPEKDLQNGVLALYGGLDQDKPQFVFIAQGNFVPDKMIAYAKSQNPDIQEEAFNGVTLYHMKKEEGTESMLGFPKTGLAAMGDIEPLKQALALIQGQGRSVLDNPLLSKHHRQASADALVTAIFLLPESAKAKQEKMPPPFEFDLSKAEAFTGELFYSKDIWSGSLSLISPNPEGNKKNANTLNSLKGLAAMMGPEVGDIVNGLSINADDKQVEIRFSINKSQLEKISKKAKENLPGAPKESSPEPSMEGSAQSN